MKTSTNDITGDKIKSKVSSNDAYEKGWELWQENKRKEREAQNEQVHVQDSEELKR